MTPAARVASLSRTVLIIVLLLLVTSLDIESSHATTTGLSQPSSGQTLRGSGGSTTAEIARRVYGFGVGGEASAHRYDDLANLVRPITRSATYRSAPNTTGGGLVQGANGALRNPATGRFAPNPARVAPEPRSGIHGNSRLSQEPTSLYRLYDFEGNYLKTGITSNPAGRYTQNFMSDKYMDIINVGSRSNMMDLERRIVELDPGPLNLERWAGAAR